jgi:catechol 2,3-dioxygenase
MKIDGINHVTLRVHNLDEAEAFYAGVLGLKRVGERAHMHFYSSGRFAHELALVHEPYSGVRENSELAHICFNLTNEESLFALHERCQTAGYATSNLISHIVMHSFYVRDPSGNLIELGVDRPAEEWRHHPQPFAEDHLLLREEMQPAQKTKEK